MFPHVHADLLTFVAEGDVWLAPAAGGRAWRVSADHAAASYPRISPDGALIAWTSQRDASPEIFLAGTDGGHGTRLTYWGDQATRMCGWTPDGEILAVTATGQPFRHLAWAHALRPGDPGQGRARRLPLGPVSDVAIAPSGTALLTGRFGREPAFWKRYRGGTAGRLWLGPAGSDSSGAEDGAGQRPGPRFRRLLADLPGQFSSPMLVSGRLAFLSDHEGTGNVYSCALDGSDLRRHTDHDGFYARNASTDGTRVVYHCAGDIWLLEDLGAASEPRRLDIMLGSPAAPRAPRLICGDDHLGSLCCDAAGQASAIEVRGTVHWLTHRDGPARALSVVPGVRARLPQVLGASGLVAWVSDADGEDALEIGASSAADLAPPRRLAAGSLGRVASIAVAPDGSAVAVAALDGRLLVVDVASGDVTELAVSDNREVTGLAWSPDSAWLAWSDPVAPPLRRVRLARPADRSIVDVTDGRFTDTEPVFTADGLHLAFLSRRNFDPVYDAHVFDLSFPYGSRPYLVPLAAPTPSPFGPLPGGRPIGDPQDQDGHEAGSGHGRDGHAPAASPAGPGREPRSGGRAEARGEPGHGGPGGPAEPGDEAADRAGDPAVVVDAEGLPARVVQVPVPESRYSSLRAVKGGLAWLREPVAGSLGQGGARADDAAPRPVLEYFDLRRRACTELQDDVDWFEASGDGRRLVVSDEGKLTVIPADRKADHDNADDEVRVDLSRARFLADPVALWRAAFAEAGRIMRHDYWVPDMAGIDWDAILDAYRPLLDRIAGQGDFADLLWEVFGELGTSHAYVRPTEDEHPGSGLVGMLGADLEPDDDGAWRFVRVVPGDSSDPRARSPLATPGVRVAPGDVLLAVDGQRVPAGPGPWPLLAGAAGKPVELIVTSAARDQPRRAVALALRDDRRLRYLDWVAGRRRLVRELGQGRLGYLHVPDMVSEGWADFNRDLRSEMALEALIVDIRGNSGGHTSQLVVEKLARRVIGWDVPRGQRADSYPLDAPRGPVVALTDEFAGSDGDIVTAAIRILGLGPVVGARTWGGVVGYDDYHELADGTAITVPRFAFWFSQLGWSVENYGVDPDVEVLQSPDDWAAGHDAQLEAGVRIALEALQASPARTAPATTDRPSRRRPSLPPRQPD